MHHVVSDERSGCVFYKQVFDLLREEVVDEERGGVARAPVEGPVWEVDAVE